MISPEPRRFFSGRFDGGAVSGTLPNFPISFQYVGLIRKTFTAGNGEILAVVIPLGLRVGVCGLYAPPTTSVQFPYSFHRLHPSSGSDTLKTVIRLFHRRLQVLVREERANLDIPDSAIPALICHDPLQAIVEFCDASPRAAAQRHTRASRVDRRCDSSPPGRAAPYQ